METGVNRVRLYREVTLDMRTLMEYSGQGKCRRVECHYCSEGCCRERLRTWGTSRNWAVIGDEVYHFVIERI